ncbi:phosphotransferase [Pseudomonas sp. Pdm06]|uniref:phosphotransferase n=1 Tax=Pseudomonas sp. Pdm06 TaxID=1790044 RepID=UPI0017864E98|nr:phosphotransferase [Pseudomonas sp. Pdm06]MBD9466384.1 phosphotransferase [Pseudomonas sp. Pdm06]
MSEYPPSDALVSMLFREYGVEANIYKLTGEADVNYRVSCSDGNDYLLKMTRRTQENYLDAVFQADTLRWLGNHDLGFSIPKVIPSVGGGDVVEGKGIENEGFIFRLYNFLPGILLNDVPKHGCVRPKIGGMVAKLHDATENFYHSRASRYVKWDIKNSHALTDHLKVIDDQNLRKLIASMVDGYVKNVMPLINQLPKQIIHGDLHPGNILIEPVDKSIKGVIDFGDVVLSSRSGDLAIACAGQLDYKDDALKGVLQVLDGYRPKKNLTAAEANALPYQIGARFAAGILFLTSHRKKFPDSTHFPVISSEQAYSRVWQWQQLILRKSDLLDHSATRG